MTWHYSVHGLALASDLPLPELREGEPGPGLRVTLGPVAPVATRGDGYAADPDVIHFIHPEVARFRITGGDTITVDPVAGADEASVRLFLLGSAMGALLHQRGLVPLHANMAVLGGRAIGFAGPSGAGKSTIAAAFALRGAPVLADDLAVLSLDGGTPVAQPGVARARLWDSAMEGLAISGAFPRVRPGMDKFTVPLGAAGPAPLARLYLLEPPGSTPRRLGGAEAVGAIVANSFRGSLVPLIERTPAHWQQCVAIARAAEVRAIPRAADFAGLARVVDALLDEFG